MQVTFIYKDDNYFPSRENVTTALCNAVCRMLSLPQSIEIEFADTGDSIYGETYVDPRFKNRIRLKSTIEPADLINVLTHELIHLNQIFTGRLQAFPHGLFVWDGKRYICETRALDYDQQQKLPWEIDVVNKQHYLLKNLLSQHSS